MRLSPLHAVIANVFSTGVMYLYRKKGEMAAGSRANGPARTFNTARDLKDVNGVAARPHLGKAGHRMGRRLARADLRELL